MVSLRRAIPALAAVLLACSAASTPDTPARQTAGSPPGSTPEERLFLLDGDGFFELNDGGRTLLAEPPPRAFAYDAAVSPDGRSVALAIQGEPTQTEVSIDFGVDLYVGLDGGPLELLIEHERIGEVMSRPVWLPGGDELLIAILGRDDSGAADLRIERVDVHSGTRERLIEDAVEPALSPDGSTLAYIAIDPTSGYEVVTLRDMASGETRPLLPPDTVMVNVAGIAWSPDAQRLAFASADPLLLFRRGAVMAGRGAAGVHPTLQDVWVVNADGSDLRRLTELADAGLSIAWAADGVHVYAIGNTGFWHIDTNSGDLQQLGEGVLAARVQTLLP